LTVEQESADPGPRQPSGAPARLRASNPAILCGLWIAVIVLAVAIDLAK
jgi:hypothetical protein